jgi:IclR family transcriptional regulator, mhp operon transcriptional activator
LDGGQGHRLDNTGQGETSSVQKPKVKTIRALSRGVDVLEQVQTSGGMSLNDLHHATLLPKATLLRILLTLQEKGLVWQRMVDNAYLPSHVLQENVRRFDEETHLVEVASPLMERLTKTVKWPSILAVPRLGHMEVIEANAPRSYFHHIPLGPVGFQINMLRSATGRAYLAFCTERECAAILTRLRASRREVVQQHLKVLKDVADEIGSTLTSRLQL